MLNGILTRYLSQRAQVNLLQGLATLNMSLKEQVLSSTCEHVHSNTCPLPHTRYAICSQCTPRTNGVSQCFFPPLFIQVEWVFFFKWSESFFFLIDVGESQWNLPRCSRRASLARHCWRWWHARRIAARDMCVSSYLRTIDRVYMIYMWYTYAYMCIHMHICVNV